MSEIAYDIVSPAPGTAITDTASRISPWTPGVVEANRSVALAESAMREQVSPFAESMAVSA
jgi:hypothetical protein